MKLKHLYLLLALMGLCGTWYYNIQFMLAEPDSSMTNFIALATTTLPAKSIGVDIMVVAFTFFAWYIPEAIRLKMRHWWIIIPLTCCLALAFTFPLFLYWRACRLEALARES